MNWQPIETAPKDGSAILVSSCFRVGESSWGICLRQHDGYIAGNSQPCWRSADGLKLFPGVITHWMPMPAKPAFFEQSTDPTITICRDCGGFNRESVGRYRFDGIGGTSPLRSSGSRSQIRQIVSDLNYAAAHEESFYLPSFGGLGRTIKVVDATSAEIEEFVSVAIASLLGIVANVKVLTSKSRGAKHQSGESANRAK